jgi:hypothetical protein
VPIEEAGVWVPDIVTFVVESAAKSVVESDGESVVISISRSFIEQNFGEPATLHGRSQSHILRQKGILVPNGSSPPPLPPPPVVDTLLFYSFQSQYRSGYL